MEEKYSALSASSLTEAGCITVNTSTPGAATLFANNMILTSASSDLSNSFRITNAPSGTTRVEAYAQVNEYLDYKVQDSVEIVPLSNRNFQDLTKKEENSLIGKVYTITCIETDADVEELFNSRPFNSKSTEPDITKTRFFLTNSDKSITSTQVVKMSLEDLKNNFKKLKGRDEENKSFLEEKFGFNLFSEEEI